MQRPDSVVLDGVGFCLSRAAKRFRDRLAPTLNDLGLHFGQELFLAQLWREDGLLQTDLARRLCVDHDSISKSVKRLVAASLVRTQIDDDDHRTSRVFLTRQGAAMQAPVEKAWLAAEISASETIGELDTAKLKSLLSALSR